jgi:hypothetical protein
VVDSVRKVRARKTRQLATDVLVVKLAAIPFFVLNFITVSFIALIGVAMIQFALPFLAVASIGSALTYPAMLSTSVYAFATVTQLRRERLVGPGLAILYVILSLIYVTDIVAAILLFGHAKRRPTRALVIVMLSLGLILMLSFGSTIAAWGVGWFGVTGMIVGLAPIIASVLLFPAMRRESQRALPDSIIIDDGSAEHSVAAGDLV